MSQQRKTILITCLSAIAIVLAVYLVGGNTSDEGPMGRMPGGDRPAGQRPSGDRPAGNHQGGERPERERSGDDATRQRPSESSATASRDSAKTQSSTSTSSVPEIGVVSVVKKSHQALVTGYGEVSPQFELTLSALVSGRIQSLDTHFVTGARFLADEALAEIDNTDYLQAVAEAQADLEDAKVALEEERLQGQQAMSEWQRSGLDGEPASELVLRGPQLAAAQATLAEAERALAQAQRDLGFTQITVPFNSLVVSRSVQPGSFVQAGDDVASLYSTDIAEIAIPLSASQWQNLKPAETLNTSPWAVTLSDMDNTHIWHGVVQRIEQHLDTASRQRNAIVQIEKPLDQTAPLYFGTYVTATIAGKTWDDVWQIPSSAISQQQEVWFVRDDNTLDNFTPDVLFMKNGNAYILPVEDMDNVKIVARPLSSYMVNMAVLPIEESFDGDR
ncbi:efflux RND transporter periplasmic adaptor subunit [Alteromonas sp. C1M14]|uniref:efflux RND transporter periplasmic adaptor subunit n=1 Tax=Alteromonas sp. C1M14 TaxID=2841567 RepID=UPI001C085B84|nr:efflux RND transporter periplasmic adaptor subunit [Alteromonas sp. C1M14]MBU2978168.1 efflux RND transporter periplasmic adaptor subunit [Alteromonas sp. C1M14]